MGGTAGNKPTHGEDYLVKEVTKKKKREKNGIIL